MFLKWKLLSRDILVVSRNKHVLPWCFGVWLDTAMTICTAFEVQTLEIFLFNIEFCMIRKIATFLDVLKFAKVVWDPLLSLPNCNNFDSVNHLIARIKNTDRELYPRGWILFCLLFFLVANAHVHIHVSCGDNENHGVRLEVLLNSHLWWHLKLRVQRREFQWHSGIVATLTLPSYKWSADYLHGVTGFEINSRIWY